MMYHEIAVYREYKEEEVKLLCLFQSIKDQLMELIIVDKEKTE